MTMPDGSRYRFGKRFSEDGAMEMDIAEIGPSDAVADYYAEEQDINSFSTDATPSTGTNDDTDGDVTLESELPGLGNSNADANSLRALMKRTVTTMTKRSKAKEEYMKKHKKLMVSYEKKLLDAHKRFIKRSGHLAKDTATNELQALKTSWLAVPIKNWDSLICKHYYDKSVTLWNHIKGKRDMKKSDDGDMQAGEGDVTKWVLNLFHAEEKQRIKVRKKQDQNRRHLASKVISIAGLQQSAIHEAVAALQENDDDVSRAITALLDGQVNADRLGRISRENESALRRIICRVVSVDTEQETVKVVMVLDRNERPCLGGVPKVVEEIPPPPPPVAQAETPEETNENDALDANELSIDSESDGNEPEEENGDLIPGTICRERPNANPIEYYCDLEELLSLDDIQVLDEKAIELIKSKYEDNVPSLTYQKQRHGDDFQLIDLGVKLGLEPLSPLQEYTPEWRSGTLYSLKHNKDGPVRFVGYNETGFGLIDQTTPMQLFTQQILNASNEVVGVNVVHMTLFDINDQVSFDRLYLKVDENLDDHHDGKIFARNASGERLKYRIVAQHDQVVAVLYPFQGRVRRANLVQQIVPPTGTIVSLFGTGRIGRLYFVPVGMVIGEAVEDAETTCKFPTSDMTEMLRTGVRHFPEFPGMVDVEILVGDDGALIEPPLKESWPVECVMEATEDLRATLAAAYERKEQEKSNYEARGRRLFDNLKLMAQNRPLRIDKATAGETLSQLKKLRNEVEKVQKEISCVKEKEYKQVMNAIRSYQIALTRAVKAN